MAEFELLAALRSCKSLEHFELLELKGGGCNGSVFRARCRRIPYLDFAMKICYNLGVESTSDILDAYKNEYEILIAIPTHPNVNRIFVHFTDRVPPALSARLPEWPQKIAREGKKSLFLVMPYMRQNLREWRDLKLPTVAQQIQILLQLLRAAAFLESHGVVHLDMRLENILAEDTPAGPVVQIADFGEAKRFHPDHLEQSYVHEMRIGGNTAHLAPELQTAFLQHQTLPYWKQASFALGVVVVELATGHHPLDTYPIGFQEELVISYARDAAELPENWPSQLAAIVREMLLPDPEERLSLPAALGRLQGFDAIEECRALQKANAEQEAALLASELASSTKKGVLELGSRAEELEARNKELEARNEELESDGAAARKRIKELESVLVSGVESSPKHSAAHEAAKRGELEVLKQLDRKELRSLDEFGRVPAFYAIQRADRECIEHLFTHGGCPVALKGLFDQNVRPLPSLRLLNAAFLAVFAGFADCLPLLWSKCPELFHEKRGGLTVAFIASMNGHLDCLQFLWTVVPDFFRAKLEQDGATAAHIAAQRGYLDCLKFLWTVVPKVFLPKINVCCFVWKGLMLVQNGFTVAHVASEKGRLGCLEFLWGVAPKLFYWKAQDLFTVAHIAAQRGHVDCLEFLWGALPKLFHQKIEVQRFGVGQYADFGVQDGSNVAHLASERGRFECLQFLWGVFPKLFDRKTKAGLTVLFIACQKGHLESLQFMWRVSPKLFQAKTDGRGAAIVAAQFGRLACLKFLWSVVPESFSDPGDDGFNVAHVVCQFKHLECLKFLFRVAPELLLQKLDGGASVAFIASRFGHLKCLQFLWGAVPELFQGKMTGWSSVAIIATEEGHLDCLQFLWSVVPEVFRRKDKEGYNVASIAAGEGRLDCLQFLWKVAPVLFYEVVRKDGNIVYVASSAGHLDCLQFLFRVVPQFFRDDRLPRIARDNGNVACHAFLKQCGRK